MDLPELTRACTTIQERYDARRFKWRFEDGPAVFEAFYDGDTLERDEHGCYAPLFVSFAPAEKGDGRRWAHVYRIRKSRNAMLFANPLLGGTDYYALRDILGIRGTGGGPAWSPANFLERAQRSAGTIPGNWSSHRIRTAMDLPGSYRRNVEESDKVYWCGWRRNAPDQKQTMRNYHKTSRWLGKTIADECRTCNISTCWTDDPEKARTFPANIIELQRET